MFEPDIWPKLHIVVQMKKVGAVPVDVLFFESLAETLATLDAYPHDMLRVDYARFPADASGTRRANIGDSAYLLWRMSPSNGIVDEVVVEEIVFKEPM